jgi:hypothetical protein
VISSGLTVFWLAGFITIYALFIYCRRLKLLRTGQAYGYLDRIGPGVLAGTVTAAIVIIGVRLHKIRKIPRVPPTLTVQGDVCYQHSLNGTSLLEYQPSDVAIDQMRNLLLVPSLNQITAISRNRSMRTGIRIVADLQNADIEGLTIVNDTVFAISEGEKKSELIALQWDNLGELNPVNRWTIDSVNVEGITYIPTENGGRGRLYISGDNTLGLPQVRGFIDVYDLPALNDNSTSLPIASRLNSNVMDNGLIDSKMSALYYFEDVLYVLHDNSALVRAWNIQSGVKLSEWHLPVVGLGADKQWEGLAVEREERSHTYLKGTPTTTGDLILHLTLDSPPQVWSFRVNQDATSGQIILPACAHAW